jgi:hypothetical protein
MDGCSNEKILLGKMMILNEMWGQRYFSVHEVM